MNTTQMKISIPTDENGLVGRQCPTCQEYFSVKFGTGLPTSDHICPYCGYTASSNEFFTQEQNDYIVSLLSKEFIEPAIRDLNKSFKNLERSSSKYIKIKVKTNDVSFPIKSYQEKILETHVTCDNCGLVFSIYGVFSNCPDCGKLNSLIILKRSLESCEKRIKLSETPEASEISEDLLSDALEQSVSSFDAFGKSLMKKYPTIFPSKSRNLFQNILLLEETLKDKFDKSIADFVGQEKSKLVKEMFQVRHIQTHNAGVIDNDFIKKIPEYSNNLGRKYKLKKENVSKNIESIGLLAQEILNLLENRLA